LSKRLRELLLARPKDNGVVFGYQGESVRIIKRSWKTALKRAAIRHVRFHDLRHTFNTRLMESGVLQEIRMALMGHSSGGSKVHATYTHIELPAKRKAIAQLEAWVNAQHQQSGEATLAQPGLTEDHQ
jgi:integrase